MSHAQYFNDAARIWDDNPVRHEMAHALFHGIQQYAPLHEKIVALDFGAGTGLVTLPMAGRVGSMVAVDASPEMLAVLQEKARTAGLNIHTQIYDGVEYPDLGCNFDVIVSTMVLHHMPNPEELISQFKQWLKPGGHLAIADLEPEDGSFHGDNPTVHHHGFDPQQVSEWARQQGMTIMALDQPYRIRKPQDDGHLREYPVFLLVAGVPEEI